MSLQDSGAHVLVELTNQYVRKIFEEVFRKQKTCLPDFGPITNPLDPTQKITTKGLVLRLKKTALRQTSTGSKPSVYLDLTVEPAAGQLLVDGKPAQEMTVPLGIAVAIASGKLSITATVPPLLAVFVPKQSVTFPIDVLSRKAFTATPTEAAVKLVGSPGNLAIALALDVRGTLRQFSGECPKKDVSVSNASLNGPAADLAKFSSSYNTALLSATDYRELAFVIDKSVLAAMIKTIGIDKKGSLIGTRLWLEAAGPGKMTIKGQGCTHHSTCAGDWWDAGWRATATMKVQGSKVVIDYAVVDAYLTDTDSGWDSCVDAVGELKKRGLDSGVRDIGISANIADRKETGKVTISDIVHRAADAAFYCTSTLTATAPAWLDAPNEVLFASACGSASVPAETVTLGNSGFSPLYGCYLKLAGKDSGQFALDTTSEFTLGPGGKKSVKITYKGGTGKNHQAELRVGTNAGLGKIALLAFMQQSSLSYPTALSLVGKSKINLCTGAYWDQTGKNFELKNTGKGAVRICKLSISGTAKELFAVGSPGVLGTSAPMSLPHVIKPGWSLWVRVEFLPSKKDLNKDHMASLHIESNLAPVTISLHGRLDRAYDGSSGGASWSFSKSLVCGKLLYDPPRTSIIPRDLMIRFVNLLWDPDGVKPWDDGKALLFLELQVREAPRDLRIDVVDREGESLAGAQSRFRTKVLVFPYVTERTMEIRLSLAGAEVESGESRFALRNWIYEPAGELAAESVIADYAVHAHRLFAAAQGALLVGDVDAAGQVEPLAEVGEWAEADAVTVVGGRLVVARDGCHILDPADAQRPELLASLGVDGLSGLYSPDRQLHHIDSTLGRTILDAGLLYGLGERLHVIEIGGDPTQAELTSFELPTPVSSAFAWGTNLYAVGDQTVHRLDISDPRSPTLTGSHACADPVTTAFAFGCLAVLGHEGPAASIIDLTQSDRLEQSGSYASHPEIEALFPSAGPIFMDGRFTYSLRDQRSLVVGRLANLTIDDERLEELRG